MELGSSPLLVMATTNRCPSFVDLTRELWYRTALTRKTKVSSVSVCQSDKVGLKHPSLVTIPHIRYPRRTINFLIIFIFLSRSSIAKVCMKTKMGTLLFRTVVHQRFIRSIVVVAVVVSHIQRIGCRPEKNYFTRWPISLVVC